MYVGRRCLAAIADTLFLRHLDRFAIFTPSTVPRRASRTESKPLRVASIDPNFSSLFALSILIPLFLPPSPPLPLPRRQMNDSPTITVRFRIPRGNSDRERKEVSVDASFPFIDDPCAFHTASALPIIRSFEAIRAHDIPVNEGREPEVLCLAETSRDKRPTVLVPEEKFRAPIPQRGTAVDSSP